MTGYERIENVFSGRSVDRIPAGEDFWGETIKKWRDEGHLAEDESPVEHFALDMDRSGMINRYVLPDFKPVLVEETDDTRLVTDGNGATLRHHKFKNGAPEHVDFRVKDLAAWESFAKPGLVKVDERRIPFEKYRAAKSRAAERKIYFANDSLGPFELMHNLCGHEALLMNAALDPDWIKDMVITYAEFNIKHWQLLFEKEGLPTGTWIAEDLGYKFKPFMSPAMFEEIFLPGYVRMFDFLHGKGLKIMMHSCGYIEPLLPMLIEAGLDCLEAMEFKAGMDIRKLFDRFGDTIAYCGNIDVRVIETNERSLIQKELHEKVLPIVQNGGRYILHSDHSISPKVEYDTFRAYLDMARDL